jgi:hypothetical protein
MKIVSIIYLNDKPIKAFVREDSIPEELKRSILEKEVSKYKARMNTLYGQSWWEENYMGLNFHWHEMEAE